ncbi:MAG: glycosyltransferase family 9 protein [Opitutaceae bacterium]
MKILVLRGGALGDFVVTLPAIGLLRAGWPEARIELAGNARAAQLGLCPQYLDTVHSQHDLRWNRLGADMAHALDPGEPLARWLAGFDLVVNFWPDPDGAIARDFAMLGFKAEGGCIAIHYPAQPEHAPAAAHFCEALRPLGLQTRVFTSRIRTTPAARVAAEMQLPNFGGARIAWHPGSGSMRKNWPIERWLEVIRQTIGRDPSLRLVVILGEADAHLKSGLRRPGLLPPHTTMLCDDPPDRLAALLERCALFLGHDTGPAHVAAAVGCKCVLVFGPTDPAMWAPPASGAQVLRRGENTEAVGVQEVEAAILQARREDGV